MDSRDRRQALLESASVNGIDFVEIANPDQTELRVHFVNTVAMQGTTQPSVQITGGENIRRVAVLPIGAADWSHDAEGRPLLTLRVAAPGDFSIYTLTLNSDKLDRFFVKAAFSFKARCPSDLDCAASVPSCLPVEADVPPIDYLAKDFLSFRQALLDFSALRYPEWQERSEADFGMMFLEALSALADDLSYTQDRIAAEAALDTATQRRSVVRHARLVDYEPRPATAARVMLQLDVDSATTAIPSGLRASALSPDGAPIVFETGTGLIDPETGMRLTDPESFEVSSKWNRRQADNLVGLQPYFWDDTQRCLPAGSTEMWLVGTGFGFFKGQILLIETRAASPADPPIREYVRLVSEPDETSDTLFLGPPVALTHLVWRNEDALKWNHDLTTDSDGEPRTSVIGNIVPATQAVTLSESFTIPAPPSSASLPGRPAAIVRTGPNDTVDTPSRQYLYTLPHAPVAWLQPEDPASLPLPEFLLDKHDATKADPPWKFLRRLLDADQFENAFTLDAARFSRLGGNADGSTQYEYDGAAGDTIRFGDGTFGELPEEGTAFDLTYRVGGGALGNVAADAITQVSPAAAKLGVLAVTNPFAAIGGADAEPLDRVSRLAPQAFRAVQYRAVRPEDYQDAARTLGWVQQAGTVFRWTGSWHTVFTTADSLDSEQMTTDERTELIELLNRYRMAGYESYVPDARYVSVDLQIEVCARTDAFRGNVEATVLAALSTSKAVDCIGFFNPDRFTFGQPLDRSILEAAIQKVPGVAGVKCICYRVRNRTAALTELPELVAVATNEIIRCDNDPSFPERGSLKVIVKGGK